LHSLEFGLLPDWAAAAAATVALPEADALLSFVAAADALAQPIDKAVAATN
jgi:hypothetical protein